MALTEKNFWQTPDPKHRDLRVAAGPHPVGFTGKRGDGATATYWYRGRRWDGPTNMIGNRDPAPVQAVAK